MHNALKEIRPATANVPLNSPIKLQGEGALSYEIVRDFMETKTNFVKVDRAVAEKYLAHIEKGGAISEDMVDPVTGRVTLRIYQSYSTFSTIRSAMSYLFKLAGVERPKKYNTSMSKYMGGMKRVTQAAKQHLGLKLTEGKEAMSIGVYNKVAKRLFYSNKKEDVFCHLFFVLDWCLMKRAENCVHAKINHISFNDDALVFSFAKTKGNQTGDEFGPWHVYANPDAPWICPHLAFARYICCYPDVLRADAPLFEGNNQYKRYSERLSNVLEEMELDGDLDGKEASDFGSHSVRKGVATWVAAGCTVSPPIVSLCLRAGWSLGGVKDRYLFYENAGDQYVGRCASGLATDTTDFAISRPYFDFTSLEAGEGLKRKKFIKLWLSDRLPNGIPKKSIELARNCFSTICYHYRHLQDNLDKNCVLRQSPIFKDIPESIYSVARIAYPWNKTTDTPTFTGIPPHVTQLSELKSVQEKLDALKGSLMDEMKSEMEKRGFASTECNTMKILDAMNSLGKMIASLSAGGGKKASAEEDVDDEKNHNRHFVVFDEDEAVEYDVHEENEYIFSEEEVQLRRKKQREKSLMALKRRKLTMGSHHGSLTPLPQDWKFPSMTWTQLIHNWLLGNEEYNIPPLVYLDVNHVRHCNNGTGNSMRNNMKAMMSIVEKEAREKGCWVEKQQEWTTSAIQNMIDEIRVDFIKKYLSKSNRKGECSWSTVYTRMSAMGVFGPSRKRRSKRDRNNPKSSTDTSKKQRTLASMRMEQQQQGAPAVASKND
jgi:hypothetical protein